jgi:hypothetical protein
MHSEAVQSTLITPKVQVRAVCYFPDLQTSLQTDAGGGHAPDIIVVCEQDNVLPSSTNPTRPFARNTLDEHLDVSGKFVAF